MWGGVGEEMIEKGIEWMRERERERNSEIDKKEYICILI